MIVILYAFVHVLSTIIQLSYLYLVADCADRNQMKFLVEYLPRTFLIL